MIGRRFLFDEAAADPAGAGCLPVRKRLGTRLLWGVAARVFSGARVNTLADQRHGARGHQGMARPRVGFR